VKIETSPLLGQHNEEVFVGELGLEPERFAELKTNGVI
jgi:formyl-CoA transferase